MVPKNKKWKNPPTFESLYVESDSGHHLGLSVLLRLEVVQHRGLARVVQPHHQQVTLPLPQAQGAHQAVQETHDYCDNDD